MPKTPRTQIPYPTENQDPFYEAFVGMVEALDAALYAGREDRQLLLMGGGTFTFIVDPISQIGTLSWGAAVDIAAPITGFRWTFAAGSMTLIEGDVLFVNISRAPLAVSTVTIQKGSQVPSSDSDLLICQRRGPRIYFRNGRSMQDGDIVEVLQGGTGGGGGGAGTFKLPARSATAANVVALNGGAPNTTGGVALATNDRVLVWQQTAAEQNGIYVVQTLGTGVNGTWIRAPDANVDSEMVAGTMLVVTEGTYADKTFELVTNNPIVLGTTPLVFAPTSGIGAPGQTLRAQLTMSIMANTALGTPVVAGNTSFRGNDYLVDGTTVSTRFVATAYVTDGGTTGTVRLYDLTSAGYVASGTLTFAGTTTATQQASIVVLSANPAHIYEVRITVTAGGGSIFCQYAGIEVLNTF